MTPTVAYPQTPVLPHLTAILRPWRWTLAVVALFVLVGAALELVPPLVMRQIVDEHLTVGRSPGLLALALFYLLATAAVQGASGLAAYLTALAAQGALHGLRVRLFAHLQRLPVSYYDRTPLGETISRCTADVETLDTLFSSGVANLVADLVRLAAVAVAMVALSPPLAFVSALAIPPLLLVTRVFQLQVRAAERDNRRAVGLLNTHLQETLAGAEVIRAFARERLFVARFRWALRGSLAAFNRATIYAALYPPTMAILAALATALLLWAGTRQAFGSWGISLGTLTAFILLFQRFFKPITTLGDEWQTVQSALSGAERIFQVLGLPADEESSELRVPSSESPHPSRNSELETRNSEPVVEMRDATFGYFKGRPVLDRVSLAVMRGEHVVIVGRTGAGKSTLLSLLAGLYAPWSGGVRLAGLDPRDLALEERRRVVGVVPQAVQLFSGTVRENLTLYDEEVPPEVVERAAVATGADAIIRALPQAYETALAGTGGGRGVQLSAGQRQLLALTRALVWQPATLLLDEATAAVDAASEAAFRAALRAGVAASGCGVLTVAHRLSTAREADRVVVLEAGRVVEEGPPDELIRGGGRFAALVDLEAAGWDWQAAG